MTLPLRVAAIVLNWRGLNDTRACAESLRASTYPYLRVYLVDNGSGGEEAETLAREFPKYTVIANLDNLGFTGGNNEAMQRALRDGADAILLLNNDTVVDPDFLEPLAAALNESGVGMVGPRIAYFDHPQTLWWAGGRVRWNTWFPFTSPGDNKSDVTTTGRLPEETDWITGCCVLARTETIQQIGGLDPAFGYYCEDVDWSLRARRAGWKLRYVPQSRILHRVNRSVTRAGVRGVYYQHRNTALAARRDLGFWQSRPVVFRAAGWALRHALGEAGTRPALLQAAWDTLTGREGLMPHPGTGRLWQAIAQVYGAYARLYWRVSGRLRARRKAQA